MRVLHLYAGIGGNRKLWTDCEVTAVESDPEIAALYKSLYPDDFVIVGDAHETLRRHWLEFDFIWSSPPCQTHSRMVLPNIRSERQYPDLRLYEEIIFLQTFCKVPFVVENVVPYYTPLVPPTKRVGRHLFWSNFEIHAEDVPCPPDFINMTNVEGLRKIQDWLGIYYENPIYYAGNHCVGQVARNAVHPLIGLAVFNSALGHKPSDLENLPLFAEQP